MPVIAAPSGPTHRLPGVELTSLATPTRGSRETSVWQLEMAPGTPPTPHELTREEVFVILAGVASVRIGDERSQARAGDAVVVPPGIPFELANAGDTPVRAMVCLPVGGQARADGATFTPPWAE